MSDVTLSTLSEDLGRLLTEVSFQLTDANRNALPDLGLSEAECDRINHLTDSVEQSFRMLVGWVALHLEGSLGDLLSLLATAGVAGIEVVPDCSADLGSVCVKEELPERNLLCTLARKLAKRTRFVGRLLGVTESVMDGIECDYAGNSSEQSFHLLLKWQREKGCSATSGALARAVCRLFSLDHATMCDAWFHLRPKRM